MPPPFNVLISSAGRRHALLRIFRTALDRLGLTGDVVAIDASPLSAAYQVADRSFLVPRTSSPEFIPAVLDLCRRQRIRLLIPTIDPELALYAAHREAFERIGTTVAISSPEVVAIGRDKERTHRWLAAAGFPTPRQTTVEVALRDRESWPFPLFVKPVNGSASVGAAVVHDDAELATLTRGGGFIVQTVARGAEHTIDFLADRSGRCRCAVPRQRLEVRGGEVTKAVTVRSEAMQALVARLCEALPGAYGTLCVQVFLDPATGALEVIELNPRFGGGFPLTWAAGADFARWMIEELLGLRSSAALDGWQDGLVMLRYDEAVFVDRGKVGW